MTQKNKILITGASGFIGANLTYFFLKLGFDIHIFIRNDSDTWRIDRILKRINVCHVDLCKEDNVKRNIARIQPDYILHTACYGGYPGQNDAKKIYDVNFLSTVNLVNSCRDIDFKLFVNTGSSSEYGIKNSPMVETDILEPLTDYGVSKASATLYLQAFARRFKKPIATLRLFSPYGYFESAQRLIPCVIIFCVKKRNPRLSSPHNVRDFVFIEDVVEAYLMTLKCKRDLCGEIFNIGSGHEHTVSDVVESIVSMAGKKVRPKWSSLPNDRIEPARWHANITKAKKVLGWAPKNNLHLGLKKTIDWFSQNLDLYAKNRYK